MFNPLQSYEPVNFTTHMWLAWRRPRIPQDHAPCWSYQPPLTVLACFLSNVVPMTITSSAVDQFFDRYATALLARDAKAIADMYAVPSLILFPGQSVAVSDAKQTEEFFASSWAQYEGVDTVDKAISIMGSGLATVWAEVTWSYAGDPREHFCYQLIEGSNGPQIAVLTLMD